MHRMDIVAASSRSADLKHQLMLLAQEASTEISPRDAGLLPTLARYLAPGRTIYVAHPPKSTLDDVVRAAVQAEALGFKACPHIVARRLPSERALREALTELREGAVEQVLLIGGDPEKPAGRFSSTLEVLEVGATIDAGFARLGVAGYPEGHRAIGSAMLWNVLREKQAFAERTGMRMQIVTQFGFNPEAIVAWLRRLAEHGVHLPARIGIAGPTPFPKLIKFAMQCGIRGSLAALVRNMSAMNQLTRLATSPDELLVGLVQSMDTEAAALFEGVHLYSFGGAVATARWLHAVENGSFDLSLERAGFSVHA
jgi:methylenetetrahydrofolate reductase (NADH)